MRRIKGFAINSIQYYPRLHGNMCCQTHTHACTHTYVSKYKHAYAFKAVYFVLMHIFASFSFVYYKKCLSLYSPWPHKRGGMPHVAFVHATRTNSALSVISPYADSPLYLVFLRVAQADWLAPHCHTNWPHNPTGAVSASACV